MPSEIAVDAEMDATIMAIDTAPGRREVTAIVVTL
jgi:hypothetical protein